MICDPCKRSRHSECPSRKPFDDVTTGLSPESERIQRSGLCACQHKAACGCSMAEVRHEGECPLSKSTHGESVQLVVGQ